MCAYAFAAKYMGSGSQLTSFDSGSVENLACYGGTLLVCLPRRSLDSHNNPIIIIRCLSLAGSSLPLSITSGVSSGGIAPSVGQYGFVSMHSICWFHCPGPGAGLVYPVWQIYSTTRIFTLIAVILAVLDIDVTVQYNCEVRMIHIYFIWGGRPDRP